MKRGKLLLMNILVTAFLVGALPPLAWSQGRGQGFRPCPYKAYVCPVKKICQPFDQSGKVTQVLTESLESGMYPGMALVLDTKSQGQVHVHLGPVWYLERQEFEFLPGDEVQVKGMSETEKDGRVRVIAYEVYEKNHVLHLRDAQGRPNWEAWRAR